MARAVEVEHFSPGTVVVRADGNQVEYLYVVRSGHMRIVDRGRIIDELGPGDTFGHISLLSGLPPAMSAVAANETVCYRLPDPRLILDHSERLAFGHYNSMVARPAMVRRGLDVGLRVVGELMRRPLWCDAGDAIEVVARRMTEQGQSCAIFQTANGIGIVSDSDFRAQIARVRANQGLEVHSIGSVPPTVRASATSSAAYLEMIRHDVHHLVVLDDVGRPVGVTHVTDLSSGQIHDPLIVRSAIERAESVESLVKASALLPSTAVELAESGLPALRASALLGALAEAIVIKAAGMRPVTLHGGGQRASWLVLGSLARREPLPQSDVDTALVWSDLPGASYDASKQRLASAERVIELLEACSLRRCVDGANASSPRFNRKMSDWTAALSKWGGSPDRPGALLRVSILADARAITDLELGRSLND